MNSCRKFIHKRFNILYYIGQKYGSIGGFLVARKLARDVEIEVVEEKALMSHLAVRHRRLVIPKDMLHCYKNVDGQFWYIILSSLSGLHRWGIFWRRIIASTLLLHALRRNINIGDSRVYDVCEIIALSLAEVVINFASMYGKIYGEETYSIAEPLRLLKNDVRKFENIIKRNEREILLNNLGCLYNEIYSLVDHYKYQIIRELEEWFKQVSSKKIPDKRVGLGLLDVYSRYRETYESCDKMYCASSKDVYVVAPTETFSPFELYLVLDICRRLEIEDVLIVYSPETLPQVLFSLLTYQYIINRDRLKDIVNTLYNSGSNQLPYAILESLPGFCHKIHLAVAPCKSPVLVYSALKRTSKLLRSDSDFKLVYAPETVSTVPILTALMKFENEGKAVALIE